MLNTHYNPLLWPALRGMAGISCLHKRNYGSLDSTTHILSGTCFVNLKNSKDFFKDFSEFTLRYHSKKSEHFCDVKCRILVSSVQICIFIRFALIVR